MPALHAPALDASEGDINQSAARRLWAAPYVDSETRDLLEKDSRVYLHQALSTPCLNVLERAEGIWLIDTDGRRIMVFLGNSVHQLGHGHPQVVAAIRRQMDTLPFSPRRYTNRAAIALAQRLGDASPGGLRKVLFAPGGTTAVGVALKLAPPPGGTRQCRYGGSPPAWNGCAMCAPSARLSPSSWMMALGRNG